MESSVLPLILLGVMVLFAGIFYFITKNRGVSGEKKEIKNRIDSSAEKSGYKKNANTNVDKEDIFKFMDFDKIQDNMIIQKNGEKYTAVIKCKGINYSLMSEVEQLSVEEGFINFLNTLKFPIQLYVQAQNIDLKESINKYKENLKPFYEKYDDMNSEYNMLVHSLESSDEEIQMAEYEKNSVLNVLEYGQDIVKYVERLSLNKSMLQRNFYVLVSYYRSEITNISSFKKEEIQEICYRELFTRVQNIMSGLSMSSVDSLVLSSNELAELLYSAYNRDDKNYISVKQALDSGFHRLYSTSKDAITKKQERLLENLEKEAEYKAISALAKALEDGQIATQDEIEDEYDQETSKEAIEIIKRENVSDDIKGKAKKIIIDEYKKSKSERIAKAEEKLSKSRDSEQASDLNNSNETESTDDSSIV